MGDTVRISRPLVPPTHIPKEESNVLEKSAHQLIHGAGEIVEHGAVHLFIDTVELAAETVINHGLEGSARYIGAQVVAGAARVIGPIGLIYAEAKILASFHNFMFTANISEGVTGTMLKLAQDDSPRGYGVRAALVGYTPGELNNLAKSYPPASFELSEFLDGVEAVGEMKHKYPDGIAEAERMVRTAFRSAEDGYAAGLLGWHPTTLDSNAVSEEAWNRARTDLSDRNPETLDLLSRVYAGRGEGFAAARAGTVSAGRVERDFAYRLGVRYFNDAQAMGAAEVDRRSALIDGDLASVKVPVGSTFNPIAP
jgi:hypothetical protein